MLAGPDGPDWIAIDDAALPVQDATAWAERPDCGAVVTFTGRVRDHAEGRSGVTHLEYEAYVEQALPRMAQIVATARQRWPQVARVACMHRVGRLDLGDAAVTVSVSSPHRAEAFEAARYVIDTLKETVPIWKRETWRDGQDWGSDAQPITELRP